MADKKKAFYCAFTKYVQSKSERAAHVSQMCQSVTHYSNGNIMHRHLYQKGRITRRVTMKTAANMVKMKLHVFLQPA